MLWIALAIGAVLGIGVFLVITLFRWMSDSVERRRKRIEEAGSYPRGALPDHGASETSRRAAALRAVDDVRQEMGLLRTDVVWTITNSALWDMAVPASRSFFTALMVWEDQLRNWDVEEVVNAAGELKVLWKAAIETATRLGINHLAEGDRRRADTAIKLVRKAASTGSEAERHQLMTKAAEVLSGIVSITLPQETMRELDREATRPALPDVRDDSSPTESE